MMNLRSLPAWLRHTFMPAALTAPLARDKADTLLILLVSFCVLLPHVSHLPTIVSTGCCLLLAWRAVLTVQGRELPRKRVLGTIVVVSMGAIWWSQHNVLGRDTGVIMLTLLLTLKLLEMRARRDFMIVVMLAYFLLVTTFFYTQSIPMALLVLLDVVLLLTVQVTFQSGDALPRLRQRLKFGALILSLALPLTLLLFLVFPRIQGPLWGTPDPLAGQTGISDSMTPGSISTLAQSEEIAFRVHFEGVAPAPEVRYWRANVMTDYDGFTWRRGELRIRQFTLQPNQDTPVVRQDITLEPTQQNWVMALEIPVTPPELPGKSTPRQRTFISEANEILTRLPVTQRIRYQVSSIPGLEIAEPLNSYQRRTLLHLPPGANPRTRALAEQWRSEAKPDGNGDPTLDIVNRALTYFRQRPFSYTLSPPLLPQHDGMDAFLFEYRAGFCEHYASAFTVLMRAAGIPARVVSGYQGGQTNPVDGMLEVRQSDAHAWSEVWVAGRGWLRVDPTAAVSPDRILRGLNAALPKRGYAGLGGLLGFDAQHNLLTSSLLFAREHLDAINNRWNQMVLNYNPQQQQSLFERLGINEAPRTYGARLVLDPALTETERQAILNFVLAYEQARYSHSGSFSGSSGAYDLTQTLRLLLKSLR